MTSRPMPSALRLRKLTTLRSEPSSTEPSSAKKRMAYSPTGRLSTKASSTGRGGTM